MSGSRPTPAEQHLGDRLAALIDGELGHDARERVLAHLATCPKCKAEADAQRSLKSVFAQAAPPPPTESFLARLQGLPGGGDDTGRGGGFGGGVFPVHEPFEPDPFTYASDGAHGLLPSEQGFRIHHVGRTEAERAATRGRRFAFAAAGAVSLAAIALGGVSAGSPGPAAGGDVRGPGSNASPERGPGTANAAPADSARRRNGSSSAGQDAGAQRRAVSVPAVPAEDVVSRTDTAPLYAEVAPHPGHRPLNRYAPLAPLLTDAAVSPFFHPATDARSTSASPSPSVTATETVTTLSDTEPVPSASASPLALPSSSR